LIFVLSFSLLDFRPFNFFLQQHCTGHGSRHYYYYCKQNNSTV